MRGQGIKHLWHDGRLQHQNAFRAGFWCLKATHPLTVWKMLKQMCSPYRFRFTPANDLDDRDGSLEAWRITLNWAIRLEDDDGDGMCEQLDYSVAYLMHGEPRTHGCLDSGL